MVQTIPYVQLLRTLIATPSLSREESATAEIIFNYLKEKTEAYPERISNNVWMRNKHFDENKPTVLLNSHHDTVKPNASYTRNPIEADIIDGKLFGLGSNDAGGALVCLIETFVNFYHRTNLPFNIILLASAEEEISGANGVELALKHLPQIDYGIVGEPTLLDCAIAEKGLMVIDATAHGIAGHAARNEGLNAIQVAFEDFQTIQSGLFPKVSEFLGAVKATVTQINAGTQHNVIPDTCKYVIDVRVNEKYSLQDVLEVLQQNLKADLKPRSVRLQSSKIDSNHPLVKAIDALNINKYGSPTLSDQALMSFPTIKIGPGDSARSHTADEFIFLKELEAGVKVYSSILEKLCQESGVMLNEKT